MGGDIAVNVKIVVACIHAAIGILWLRPESSCECGRSSERALHCARFGRAVGVRPEWRGPGHRGAVVAMEHGFVRQGMDAFGESGAPEQVGGVIGVVTPSSQLSILA